MAIQKITPFLWFDTQAEEAAQFYTAIFPNSTIEKIGRYGDAGPGPPGSVMTVEFILDGHKFVGLNGGPHYQFSPAVSFKVSCEDQAEVDHYWNKLSAGGREVQCGWLQDKFGLSWQIVPQQLIELLSRPDKTKSQQVMKAMLGMIKLDIAQLQAAYDHNEASVSS